ncbi:unnamed protein product [Menidia menidia]|uniref:(Atlantic silverside) hypothetical protein n=1 Tax=Menidia menidia TaxID=238744 RepID=A0A8S4A7U0_9TELE|nr:unnamed protein product [Menidia menidia]
MSGSQWDELCTAAARGERDKVLDMLQQGVNVDGLNKFQRTALQVGTFGAFLPRGAVPNGALAHVSTLIIFMALIRYEAAWWGFVLLGGSSPVLGGGGGVTRPGSFHALRSAFAQVAQLGHGRLVRDLLEAGADPNRPDPVLRLTATHDAAREGFPESVRALLEHGADVNLPDAHGNLPLHLAAREGHLEVVKLLGARTAHPGAANGQGRSARQLARDFGRARAAEYLQKHLESDVGV